MKNLILGLPKIRKMRAKCLWWDRTKQLKQLTLAANQDYAQNVNITCLSVVVVRTRRIFKSQITLRSQQYSKN